MVRDRGGRLCHGDNLEVMRGMDAETADLIYADPPFGTGKDWGAYVDKRTGDEYLAWIEPRLIEMRRVLAPTGSIYLHCDPTMSHYLKVLMDEVFSRANFRNEIIWHYRRWTGKAKRFQRLHDCLLFYVRSANHLFNVLYDPYTDKSIERRRHHHTRTKDRKVEYVTSVNPQGVRAGDVWHFPFINPAAKERVGYPTQKPLALLNRIVEASSNPGDVVLDPFCGSGTALVAAQSLERQWVGIDSNHDACKIAAGRLSTMFETVAVQAA